MLIYTRSWKFFVPNLSTTELLCASILENWKKLKKCDPGSLFAQLFTFFKLATRQWPESRPTLKYLLNLSECWNMFQNVKWNVEFHISMVLVSWFLSNFLNSDFCGRVFFYPFCELTKWFKSILELIHNFSPPEYWNMFQNMKIQCKFHILVVWDLLMEQKFK